MLFELYLQDSQQTGKRKSMKENYSNNEALEEMPELTEADFERAIPYKDFKAAKKQTTIRLRPYTIYYFQLMAKETGIPYQTLINMYLDDCAIHNRKIDINWKD